MSEPAPDVDPDRDFRTVPDGRDPRTGGASGDPGDEVGPTESDQDLVRRAAGMKPSRQTGHAGSSSDRPPDLDPE